MELEDLAAHRSTFTRPISTTYRGHRIYEIPPPTQVSPAHPPACCRPAPASTSAALQGMCGLLVRV